MNREIKFRAWDKDANLWIGDGYWYYDSNGHCARWTETKQYDPAIILMQYTGLKDKNGNEIYEGDVIQVPENNVLAVVVFEKEQAGFFAQIKSFDEILSARIDHPELRGIQVIGNIYENPELLNI